VTEIETPTAQESSIGSLLVADCGTVTTKVVLLDRVGGHYRFVARGEAPTTAESPWTDVSAGIRHATEQIAQVTGREFFDRSGDLITSKIPDQQTDIFAATTSASEPLHVVLGGLVRDLSVASAERAAAGTYSLVNAILASDGRGGLTEEERVRTIHRAKSHVICIAGGLENGAVRPVLELVDTAALACSLMDEGARPRMLFAGNSQLRQRIAEIVKGRADLRVADNVRPTLMEENLINAQEEMDELYRESKMSELPGMDVLTSWSSVPVTPTARALSRVIQYLWHVGGNHSKGVIGIDVGAANTAIAAVFDGTPYLTINGNLGVAFGGRKLVESHGTDVLTRWMPEPMTPEEVYGLLINKEVHPASIPQERRELWLEQGLAREAMRMTLEMARPGWKPGAAQPYRSLLPLCDTIIVSGGVLASAARPGQTALMVLDALQPIGVTTLVLDKYGLAPALGNVAAVKPLAAVEALDSGCFVNLATVVAPVGRARPGGTILTVKVSYDDGSSFSVEVQHGQMEVLPLPPGQQAVLELRPRPGIDVGIRSRRDYKQRVSGGLAGLIIDARGRPLHLLGERKKRLVQLQQWLWDVGA
jgi:uncharacterized protein (TIGR01319 family)